MNENKMFDEEMNFENQENGRECIGNKIYSHLKEKRLVKSSRNRMVCGVCAGIAEYFGIDPTIVRLGWAIFCALGGSGVLAYIIAAVVMPGEEA